MTHLLPAGEPVSTWGEEEAPAGFAWRGVLHSILEVCNRWRVHTRWWDPGQAIWREYIKVTTDTGLLCLLYQDLLSGNWFVVRVYD